jgi:phage tail sheath protein FI
LYVSDVINGVSKYIYVKSSANGTLPTSTTSGTGSNVVKYFVPLVGGDNGNTSLEYNADGVWKFFDNKELTPVNIAVMVPRPAPNAFNTSSTRTSEVSNLSSVISKRMDLLATVQVGGYDEIKKTVLVTKNITQFGGNDSYFAKYVGWNLVYDRYNASRVYLPNCIYAAAIMARTDRLTKPWEAPAGQDRGIIPAGKQNMFIKPEDGADLYKNYNLNTIKFINGLGSVIWGQKTAQLKNTARDRINVRRGLIYIENGSEKILNGFMFRGNTAKERERAASMVTAFMNTVKAGGGVTSFSVICDDTNNTQATIARNELYVDIILVPTYTIEFIKLRVTINATSVSVGEV